MALSMEQFLDYQINTGPVFLSGDQNIINNVSDRSFILGKFLRGTPKSVTLQGGNKIQETLFLQANRTFESFKRNGDVTFQNPQKDVLAQLDWRFHWDHMSYDEAEYLLQTGGLSGSDLKVKYKDMAYSKQQRLWDSAIHGLEAKIWQSPAGAVTYGEMELAGGGEMYSIPVFVNEGAGNNGRFDSNWTTIEQVNPATYTNWDNKRAVYDATDIEDTDGDGDGLFDAFDDISIEIGYERPGFKDEYFEPDNNYSGENPKKSANTIIATSKTGLKQVMRLHRKSNDSLIQPQDGAYPLPRYNGIAIKDVAALDTAPLYSDGSTGFVGEAAAARAGARYYFLNCQYMKMIFHSQKYFHMRKPKEPERKLGVHVLPVEVWNNLVCTSRRHQGLVSPA